MYIHFTDFIYLFVCLFVYTYAHIYIYVERERERERREREREREREEPLLGPGKGPLMEVSPLPSVPIEEFFGAAHLCRGLRTPLCQDPRLQGA